MEMKPWLPPVLIIGALAGLTIWSSRHKTEPVGVQFIRCADPVAGCAFVHRGQASQLRFSSLPEPLKPFDIELNAPAAAKVSVRFQMGGMEMGFNRYDFKPGGGVFKANAILLPVCTQARSDWSAFFALDDTSYQVSFQTR
jgi:hypothetical protein